MDEIKHDALIQDAEKPSGGTSIKPRSETPYPYFGLVKVMDIVKAVQSVGGNSEAPAAEVRSFLKIGKTTDRQWAYGIPAAILFNVIERIGRGDDARLKLTDLGRRLALPGTLDEERASKAEAIKTPELYAKLIEQFSGNPLPDKEVLKRILQRDHKIVESMAGNAAEAFLESIKSADLITADGKLCEVAPISGERKLVQPRPETLSTATLEENSDLQIVKVPKEFIVYQCKISGGRIIQVPLPPLFTKVDVKKMAAFLATQIDDDEESDAQSAGER